MRRAVAARAGRFFGGKAEEPAGSRPRKPSLGRFRAGYSSHRTSIYRRRTQICQREDARVDDIRRRRGNRSAREEQSVVSRVSGARASPEIFTKMTSHARWKQLQLDVIRVPFRSPRMTIGAVLDKRARSSTKDERRDAVSRGSIAAEWYSETRSI